MQAKIYFITDMRIPKLLLFHQRIDMTEKKIDK